MGIGENTGQGGRIIVPTIEEQRKIEEEQTLVATYLSQAKREDEEIIMVMGL